MSGKCDVISCHGQSSPSSESETDEPWTRRRAASQESWKLKRGPSVSRRQRSSGTESSAYDKEGPSISRRQRSSGTESCAYDKDSRCPDYTSQSWFTKLTTSISGSWISFKKYIGAHDSADLYDFLHYKFYNDRYRWELFKSILWFTIGVKLFRDVGRHLMSGVSSASDGAALTGVGGIGGVGVGGAYGSARANGVNGAGAAGYGGGGGGNSGGGGGYGGGGGGGGGGWGAKPRKLCKPKKPVIEPC